MTRSPGAEIRRAARASRFRTLAGILEARLSGRIRVVEEALLGRAAASDSPWLADRNGRTTLPFLLESHAPIDLVILMLGGNDVAPVLNLSAESIAAGGA